jgi:hypothetical protein
MGVCVFCRKENTESYWSYYCKYCDSVKSLVRLVGSEKLTRSIQFKVIKEKLDGELAEEMTTEAIVKPNPPNINENQYSLRKKCRAPPAPP